MIIDGIEWDDENIEHIGRHGVSPAEVEDVCYGLHLSRKDADSKNKGKDRFVLAGQSQGGRYLVVVIERLNDLRFRPVSAFEMSEAYRRAYRRRMRKYQ